MGRLFLQNGAEGGKCMDALRFQDRRASYGRGEPLHQPADLPFQAARTQVCGRIASRRNGNRYMHREKQGRHKADTFKEPFRDFNPELSGMSSQVLLQYGEGVEGR